MFSLDSPSKSLWRSLSLGPRSPHEMTGRCEESMKELLESLNEERSGKPEIEERSFERWRSSG